MARAGEVTQRAGPDAPHGEGAQLQRLAETVPTQGQPPAPAPPAQQEAPAPAMRPALQAPYPSGPSAEDTAPPDGPPPLQGDVTGGYDAQVFGDSQRPTEPLHAGMPFGPGPNFLPEPGQDPHQFLLTVAQGLESSPTTDRVKMLAARIRLGE